MSERKLGFGFKIGYSVGYVGMSTLLYLIFFMFFMFFMTDVAGVSPIFAGTVALIAVLWDGISDPVIGYMSDNSKNKNGRRRPYMMKGAIIAAAAMVCLFTKIEAGAAIKSAYYLILAMIFWTGLTMFDIPYNSFIVELTESQEERTSIRTYIMIIASAAVMLVLGLLNTSVAKFSELTGRGDKGWQITILLIALFGFILAMISLRVSKGREDQYTGEKSSENPLRMIKDIFATKPFKYIVSSSFLLGLINSLLIGTLVYYYTYYLKFDGGQQSMMFTIVAISGMASPVLIELACKKWKNNYAIYMVTIGISALSFLIFPLLLNVKSIAGVLPFVIFAQIASAISLWIFGFTFSYETAELDAFNSGRDRTGGFVAYESFAIKMGTAVGTWIIGFVLEKAAYNPELAEQTPKTLNAIRNLVSVYPLILYAVVIVILLAYPLKQKQYNALKDAIVKKEKGEEYSTESLAKL